jgi:ABC-type multidrug transport system fused ATPase/permease subunit
MRLFKYYAQNMRHRFIIDEEAERSNWLDLIKSYVYLLGKRKRIFLFLLAILFIVQFYQIIPPLILGKIVDFFTSYKNGQSIFTFYVYSIFLGLSFSIVSFVRLTLKRKLGNLKTDVNYDIRVNGFEKLVNLTWLETRQETAGEKAQKIQNGTSAFSSLSSLINNDIFQSTTSVIGIFVIFVFLKYSYVLFLVTYMIGFLVIIKHFYAKIQTLNNEYNKSTEKSSGSYIEGLTNILTLKSQGANKSFGSRVATREELKRYFDYQIRGVSNTQWITFQVFNGICIAVFLFLVGRDVLSASISLGSIVMFYGYLQQLTGSANQILSNYEDLVGYKTSIARMMPIFMSGTNYKDGIKMFPKNWGSISLSDVSFDYKSGDSKAGVRNINLIINNGEKIGIVGQSGCGKSTLAKLLLGLMPFDKGGYKINETNFYDIKHDSVLNNMSLILQETEMFNLSLKENITLIRKIKPEVLAQAVEISQLKEVIKNLPDGMDTLIGEKGYHLSGGERQRVGIARTVCRNPQILILDEATSSLDSRTERFIQESLQKNLKEKTMIIIAHRVSTLKDADRIYVMDEGKIVEEGKYAELIENQKSKFFQIYSSQQKKETQKV